MCTYHHSSHSTSHSHHEHIDRRPSPSSSIVQYRRGCELSQHALTLPLPSLWQHRPSVERLSDLRWHGNTNIVQQAGSILGCAGVDIGIGSEGRIYQWSDGARNAESCCHILVRLCNREQRRTRSHIDASGRGGTRATITGTWWDGRSDDSECGRS